MERAFASLVKQNLRIDLRPLTEWEGRICCLGDFFYTSSPITSCVFTLLRNQHLERSRKRKHIDLEAETSKKKEKQHFLMMVHEGRLCKITES